MSVNSAGILLYRLRDNRVEVLLAHPGGPFWSGKDEAAWTIPKGLTEADEDSLQAAKREFREETGFEVDGQFIDLGTIRQPSRKMIHIWALKLDLDVGRLQSNQFTMEWPRRSGIMMQFPEIDRAEWFDIETARQKIHKGQAGFLDRLHSTIQKL
jgi:predicted NUDIX family NTP pyrophosphohydrolase